MPARSQARPAPLLKVLPDDDEAELRREGVRLIALATQADTVNLAGGRDPTVEVCAFTNAFLDELFGDYNRHVSLPNRFTAPGPSQAAPGIFAGYSSVSLRSVSSVQRRRRAWPRVGPGRAPGA